MVMYRGNIRGTYPVKYFTKKSPTLANKIARLERVVAQRKPEILQHRHSETLSSTVTGINTFDHSVTQELIDYANFRDNVTGDKWYNKALTVGLYGFPSCDVVALRLVVYVPTRASSIWSPATNYEFTTTPDKTAYTVLYDKTITQLNPTAKDSLHMKAVVDLRNRMTQYNSDNPTIDLNNIRVAVHWQTIGSPASEIRFSTALLYCNK